ncbi:16S rRNA (adenine(1518)-N(6)/adenine(1519)-N(6))-dimethyltransferase, partial [Methylobacterium radiotolerans]
TARGEDLTVDDYQRIAQHATAIEGSGVSG